MVGSQIGNLIPDPSFGYNLCFRYPNESCQPILDIYVPRAFQWYKKLFNPMIFDPCNCNLGVPRQNDIYVLVPWPGTKYTIRGKVVASTKSRPCWVLWVYVCPWFVRALKCSSYALTNLLFGLCRSVWVIKLLINLPSPHPGAPARPSTPEMLRAKEHTPTFFPFAIYTFGLAMNPSKNLGVHQCWWEHHRLCFMVYKLFNRRVFEFSKKTLKAS
jgi:hypothetical protein